MQHISRIEIVGSERTDPEFLAGVFSPCFSATHSNDFQIPRVLQEIERLDIFSFCKPSPLSALNAMGSTLTLDAKERRIRVYSGADIKNSLSWIFNLELFNIFGRAEKVKLESSVGRDTSKPLEILFLKPLSAGARWFDHIKIGYSFQEMLLKQKFTGKISSINVGLFSPAQSAWLDFRIKGFSAKEQYRVTPETRSAALKYFLSTSLILEKTICFCSSALKFRSVHISGLCLGIQHELCKV